MKQEEDGEKPPGCLFYNFFFWHRISYLLTRPCSSPSPPSPTSSVTPWICTFCERFHEVCWIKIAKSQWWGKNSSVWEQLKSQSCDAPVLYYDPTVQPGFKTFLLRGILFEKLFCFCFVFYLKRLLRCTWSSYFLIMMMMTVLILFVLITCLLDVVLIL